MVLLGALIVIVTFVFIVKRYEARLVLFLSGVIMCLVGGLPDSIMQAFTKSMVNTTLVPTICTVMGFSYVMKLTGCDAHLVHSISGVLDKGKALLVPISFFLTWAISIALPSASGCAAAVGSILIPTLLAKGVHPALAAATILAGTWGSAVSPGTAHNPFVADLAGTDMMTVIINEMPASIAAGVVCGVLLTLHGVIFKEGANDARRDEFMRANDSDFSSGKEFKVNPLRAVVPLVPLALLVLGSEQVAVLPPISVALSMVLGVVITVAVTLKDIQGIAKEFFRGMGQSYGDIIGLIAAASVFTTGMTAIGLTGALIDMMKGSESIAQIAAAFGPFGIALISGSGDAAAFAFNGAVTPHAEHFGMTIMNLGSIAQIAGAIGRSVSPIAGAAIICAGLAKVNPIEISKRNFVPCVAATIVLMLLL